MGPSWYHMGLYGVLWVIMECLGWGDQSLWLWLISILSHCVRRTQSCVTPATWGVGIALTERYYAADDELVTRYQRQV
jgi:hypothetical protein